METGRASYSRGLHPGNQGHGDLELLIIDTDAVKPVRQAPIRIGPNPRHRRVRTQEFTAFEHKHAFEASRKGDDTVGWGSQHPHLCFSEEC